MTWGGSYLGFQTGVRSTVNHWYSILSIGGVYLDDSDLKTLSFGWHYGYEVEFTRRFSLSIDAGDEPGDEATAMAAKVAGWQYRIAEYKANLLARRWEDILKDQEAPE